MIYDKFNSSAVKSVEIVDNTVKIVYNSNNSKEYSFIAKNTELFVEQLQEEILKVMFRDNGSLGKFLHAQIKDGYLTETK